MHVGSEWWLTSNSSVSQDVPDKATQFFQHALRVAPDHTKSRLAMKVGAYTPLLYIVRVHHRTAFVLLIYLPLLLTLLPPSLSLSSSPPLLPLLPPPLLLLLLSSSSSSPPSPSPPSPSFRNQSYFKLRRKKVTGHFEVVKMTGHMTFTQKLSRLILSIPSPTPSCSATERL